VVVLVVLLPSTAWCIPHLEVSCTDRNNSKTGAIAHNSNRNNFSSSNSSTMLLPHHHSRLYSGHHGRLSTAAFHASTVRSCDILPMSASCQSKAIHLELQQLWSIIRRAHRGALHHGLAKPTIPPWRRFPREKKYYWVHSSSMSIPLLFCSILEHHKTL
jgi:hypothetical protein